MLIQNKIGNIDAIELGNRPIDWLQLEWFEAGKRILRRKTQSGREVALKFLAEHSRLTQGDIIYEDSQSVIAIEILPCECIVVKPANMFEMASACYEIGNKHLPLYFDANCLLIPLEMPLYKLLTAQGYTVSVENRRLLQPLRTTVAPHGSGNESLFTRIMKMTHNNE
jgi:urease accessory protein